MESILLWLDSAAASHPTEAYVLLFLSAVAENLFPPVPGDTVTVFGAYLVGRGALRLWPVIGATFLGSTVGFMGLFALGRLLGRDALMRLSWVRRSEHRLLRAESLARRYGAFLVLVNRFLPGLRSVISVTVGLLGMSGVRVLAATSVSILIWNGLLIWGGMLAGEHWESVIHTVGKYNRIIGAAVVAGGILYGIWRFMRRPGKNTPSEMERGIR